MFLLGAPPPIVPAIVVALMAIGTALGFYLVRIAIDIRPPMTAHGDGRHAAAAAKADEALAELSPSGNPAGTYATIGRIIRRYLDDRFGIESERMLGADIERAITRAGYPRATGRLTAHLIERCARARAAATPVDATRLAEDIRVAREVIALTAPAR